MSAELPIDWVAHRGYSRCFPENTIRGFDEAYQRGCHYVELDLQLSQDLQFMIYHDVTLARTSSQPGLVADYTESELLTFTAGAAVKFDDCFIDETIPNLAMLLDWMSGKDVTVFVEIKADCFERISIALAYQKLVDELGGCAAKCVLMSYHSEFVQYCLQQTMFRTGLVLSDWQQRQLSWFNDLDFVFSSTDHIDPNYSFSDKPQWVLFEITSLEMAQPYIKQGCRLFESFLAPEFLPQQSG